MNFIKIAKALMNGEKLCSLSLKVCFYARVSTDSDTQLNSLNNQLNYYQKYIESKSAWTYTGGYVDEGISGVTTKKRIAFKKMVEDAKKHKFDLIITKEVSRFARDLEDSIHYIRLLKANDVGIYFENQNLNTFDANSELILNIMFNLAQDESKKLSQRIKFGHNEAIKKGHVLGSSNIIGYKKDNCKLVIIPTEAKFIKKVFELYASGNYGFYKLAKKLGELNYFNKNGNLYDKDTLKRIIENPKYKGYYRGKITETIDYRTKKRIKVAKENWILYKANENIIPAIVEEELWNKANNILASRIKKNDNHSYTSIKYPLSSKIYCQEHSTPFQRANGSKSKKRPTWCCSRYLKYRLEACESPIIAEIDLYNIAFSIINNLIPKDKIIKKLINLYKDIDHNTNNNELKTIDKELKNLEKKKNMLIDLVFNGEIKKEYLKVQFENIENNIKLLMAKKKKLEKINNFDLNKLKDEIYVTLDNYLLEAFIRKFINKINVSKKNDDRHNIKLDIYLNILSKIPYPNNQTYTSIEKLRKDKQKNKFTYNVFFESL